MKEQLQQLVYEIDPGDKVELNSRFGSTSLAHKCLLLVPAIAGAILHAPLYGLAKLIVQSFFSDTDHHDSVMLGILLLTYPAYIALIAVLAWITFAPLYAIILLLALRLPRTLM
ncbi:hypothetical protein [Niabella hibiscisoli]|uniref:hypothetical protein n=1 Tax=Niabella hibiscisoli TaxID=1825928 RepID=UPI001F0FEC84|nr:hypothetical protein [Niabella hibiscisoli]MCH5714878.1 hypothetical protein [Niabella hibiscisoli]